MAFIGLQHFLDAKAHDKRCLVQMDYLAGELYKKFVKNGVPFKGWKPFIKENIRELTRDIMWTGEIEITPEQGLYNLVLDRYWKSKKQYRAFVRYLNNQYKQLTNI